MMNIGRAMIQFDQLIVGLQRMLGITFSFSSSCERNLQLDLRLAQFSHWRLGGSDRGVVMLRRMLVEQLERVERGEDPIGVVRDPARNAQIELPHERDKYADGRSFLAELGAAFSIVL